MDDHAFTRALESQQTKLQTWLSRRFPASDVPDLVQETLLLCWKKREEYDPTKEIGGWVHFRMRTVVHAHHKRARVRERAAPLLHEDDVAPSTPERETPIHAQERRAALARARRGDRPRVRRREERRRSVPLGESRQRLLPRAPEPPPVARSAPRRSSEKAAPRHDARRIRAPRVQYPSSNATLAANPHARSNSCSRRACGLAGGVASGQRPCLPLPDRAAFRRAKECVEASRSVREGRGFS